VSLIEEIDRKAERQDLHSGEWRHIYKVDRELEEILPFEEKIWQQRCSSRWVLQGNANTRFFHGVANGRRRKCSNCSLEADEGGISDPIELRKHIEGYYKKLFGSEERGLLRLQEDMWREIGSLYVEEADSLIKPFSKAEIKNALEEMNSNSAPSLDGLSAAFYKTFCDKVKGPMVEMFEKNYKGELNLSRLNYGMISLIPKLKGAK
jgi:hypothetical protein